MLKLKQIGRWADKHLKWFFTVPTILFVLGMVLFPIIYTLVLSFHSWRMSANIPWDFIGLDNYIGLFKSTRFPSSIGRTFLFTGIVMLFEILLGIAIALFLNRKFIGKNFVKTTFLMPMVATPVAIGMVWKLMYEPNIGILNYLLNAVGLSPVNWLGDSSIALYALMAVDIWQWTPMVMLIVLAGISAISTEPFESAMVDGANAWQVTWKITLPLLQPTIFTAILLRLIDALKTFDIIYSMTLGGPGYATETMNIISYRTAFEHMQLGQASAMLMFFFVVVMVISIITIKIKSRVEVDFS